MSASKISPAGLALLKSFEGFVSHPYRDAVGVWTIGYGETLRVGPSTKPISEATASRLLARRVNNDFAPAVVAADKKKLLNQHQFDALCSFVYNVGTGGLSTSTTIGRNLRAGKLTDVAMNLLDWCKAGGKTLPGLLRRRQEERALFLQKMPVLEGYRDDEKAWIHEYDKLVRQKKNVARRRELRELMTQRRKWIWAQAQKSGWDRDYRRERYHSLVARSR